MLISLFSCSHSGYFGKKGIRTFHMQRNWKWAPVVNTDKLWSLVDEKVRTEAGKNKKVAPVIDVTKHVSIIQSINLISICAITGIRQGPR